MSASRIVLVVTGSIAAYKACAVISGLVQAGHEVRVVATPSALRFVGGATFEGLSGAPVLSDLFQAGAALEHINLTRWADAVVVCPATAHTLNRFAAGLADDLAGALFLAHDRAKPFLVAPAMNPAMWQHPATQDSVEKLGRWGVRFIPVGEGRTACGEIGEGRLAEPVAILAAVASALARPARRLRVLVTSGGTAEPVDGVRTLTNASSGRTGAQIAGRLARAGHDVLLLRARHSAEAPAGCRTEAFSSYADLDAALTHLLVSEPFDAVIHAAAVSDFGVAAIELGGERRPAGPGKLGSAAAPVLHLHAHPKLVDSLRSRSSNPALRVVAFKLTRGETPAAAREAVTGLFARSGADFVVHNDLTRRADAEDFPATIYAADGGGPVECATRTELADALEQLLRAPAPALA